MIMIPCFYALVAGVFTLGKEAVLHVKPFFLTSIRLPIGGCLILLAQYLFNNKNFFFKKKFLFMTSIYGLAILIGDSFRFVSLVTIPAANCALISAMGPLFMAVAANIFLREKLSFQKVVILFLGFLSVLPMIVSNLTLDTGLLSSYEVSLGYIAAVISVLGFITTAIAVKKLTAQLGCPPIMIAGVGVIIGGIAGLLTSAAFEVWDPVPILNVGRGLPLLMILFIGHNLIGHPLYSLLINKFPVTLVSFGQLTLPFFTAIFRYLLYGDTISPFFIISLAGLVCSFYFFFKQKH